MVLVKKQENTITVDQRTQTKRLQFNSTLNWILSLNLKN